MVDVLSRHNFSLGRLGERDYFLCFMWQEYACPIENEIGLYTAQLLLWEPTGQHRPSQQELPLPVNLF